MKKMVAVRVGGVVLGLAIGLASASAVLSAQGDPHVGTWVLNLEKSKFAAGTAPKSQRSVYAAAGKGFKVTTATVNGAGANVNTEYTAELDGKDHPVKGNPDWDTTALRRVDSQTLEFTRKKDGKVVQMARSVVSKDGKTRTVSVTGVNGQGQRVNTVGLWVRQ
jgi:hypothetical protein